MIPRHYSDVSDVKSRGCHYLLFHAAAASPIYNGVHIYGTLTRTWALGHSRRPGRTPGDPWVGCIHASAWIQLFPKPLSLEELAGMSRHSHLSPRPKVNVS